MIIVRHQYISARGRRVGGKPAKVVAIGRALAHLKYIQHRPGEDRRPEGREFFNELEEKLDGRALRRVIKKMGDSDVIVHKLTLAPEINEVDKRQFTRQVMQKLADEKGLDLTWMAVEHNNTDHHHIHVIVLGKDKKGKDVRFDRNDYDRIKEYGDRHLELRYSLELKRSRDDRKRRERERVEKRTRERETLRQERIRDGLELPWMHKKILREQFEPYDQWKKEQNKLGRKVKDKDYQDEIKAAGKKWNRESSLDELKELNKYLWDNYKERIEKSEYKKLISWIKEKEQAYELKPNKKKERKFQDKASEEEKDGKKPRDYFEYQGQKYSKDTPYDKLHELSKKLKDKDSEHLPFKSYKKLRSWMEDADRSRWSGALEKQVELSKEQEGREGAKEASPNAHRYVDPLQQQLMSNPVIGLFMGGASVVNEFLSWIPTTDQRDRLKESRDELESAKLDKHQDYVDPKRTGKSKARDKETIDKLDKAIDENQATREKADDEKKRRRKERGRDDPFTFDPWGMY